MRFQCPGGRLRPGAVGPSVRDHALPVREAAGDLEYRPQVGPLLCAAGCRWRRGPERRAAAQVRGPPCPGLRLERGGVGGGVGTHSRGPRGGVTAAGGPAPSCSARSTSARPASRPTVKATPCRGACASTRAWTRSASPGRRRRAPSRRGRPPPRRSGDPPRARRGPRPHSGGRARAPPAGVSSRWRRSPRARDRSTARPRSRRGLERTPARPPRRRGRPRARPDPLSRPAARRPCEPDRTRCERHAEHRECRQPPPGVAGTACWSPLLRRAVSDAALPESLASLPPLRGPAPPTLGVAAPHPGPVQAHSTPDRRDHTSRLPSMTGSCCRAKCGLLRRSKLRSVGPQVA